MQCGICARSERTFDEKIYLLPHRDDSKKPVSRHHQRTQDPMSSQSRSAKEKSPRSQESIVILYIFIYIVFIQMKQRFHQLLRLF